MNKLWPSERIHEQLRKGDATVQQVADATGYPWKFTKDTLYNLRFIGKATYDRNTKLWHAEGVFLRYTERSWHPRKIAA